MNRQTETQCNKLMHLESSMVMYGFYNADMLENRIHTVHTMHNSTTVIKTLFAGELNAAYTWFINAPNTQQYAIDSLLYLRTVRNKYIQMYKEFITWLHIHAKAIRILAKGYLPISLITPLKLKEILNVVNTTVRKTDPDYDLVMKRLYLYFDITLVTFGIDRDRNLIILFPVFIQPYTQLPLILYEIETVPVPIIDQNTQADFYMHLQVTRPCIALNSQFHSRIKNMQKK